MKWEELAKTNSKARKFLIICETETEAGLLNMLMRDVGAELK